jgi:hypothetical protein
MALRFLIDEAAVHETSTGDSPRHNRAPSGVPGGTMARAIGRVFLQRMRQCPFRATRSRRSRVEFCRFRATFSAKFSELSAR